MNVFGVCLRAQDAVHSNACRTQDVLPVLRVTDKRKLLLSFVNCCVQTIDNARGLSARATRIDQHRICYTVIQTLPVWKAPCDLPTRERLRADALQDETTEKQIFLYRCRVCLDWKGLCDVRDVHRARSARASRVIAFATYLRENFQRVGENDKCDDKRR